MRGGLGAHVKQFEFVNTVREFLGLEPIPRGETRRKSARTHWPKRTKYVCKKCNRAIRPSRPSICEKCHDQALRSEDAAAA